MRDEEEVAGLLGATYKGLEKELGIQIRNGQAAAGIRAALRWVLSDDVYGLSKIGKLKKPQVSS